MVGVLASPMVGVLASSMVGVLLPARVGIYTTRFTVSGLFVRHQFSSFSQL